VTQVGPSYAILFLLHCPIHLPILHENSASKEGPTVWCGAARNDDNKQVADEHSGLQLCVLFWVCRGKLFDL